ncbi:MAG: trigger factor [Oscillospiraceae bacterium]|nr:trigger factor [Oscillospiraceae bacterium]
MNLISANKTGTNQHELKVSVGKEEFQASVEKAYHKNAKNINVPGFRKGKAPKHIIEKMYGEGVFYEDAVNSLYPDAYAAAVEESGIDPVDRPEVEIEEVSAGGFTFKAVVTVRPEVTLGEYKGLSAVKEEAKVTDAMVDAEIDRLKERNARVITVEDRPAADGDQTVIDFEGFVDGVPFEGGKGEKFDLTLGSGQFIPGFEEQIVGKNIGEEFDVNVTFPEDYQAAELAGKAAVFKCKLHELKAKEYPAIDDEFAKDVSDFDTLAELRDDFNKKLTEAAEKRAQEDFENKLIDKIVEGMQAEIPPCMIDNKMEELVKDFDYRLQAQGMNLETYLKYTGSGMDAFKQNFAPQAERQVKIRLALEKIVEQEGLKATDEEVEAKYAKMAETYGMEAEKIKQFVPAKEIALDLAVNKAIDMVRDTAKAEAAAEEKPAKKAAKAKKD